MMTGSLKKKKKLNSKKKKGGCSVIRACSLIRSNTVLLQNISTGLGLFWDDFQQQQNPSETWTTQFHSINLGSLECFLCKAPYFVIFFFL